MGNAVSTGDPLAVPPPAAHPGEAPKQSATSLMRTSFDAVFEIEAAVRTDDMPSSRSSVDATSGDSMPELQDAAVCCAVGREPPSARAAASIQRQLVGELASTLVNYDERFFARLRERLRLLGAVQAVVQRHGFEKGSLSAGSSSDRPCQVEAPDDAAEGAVGGTDVVVSMPPAPRDPAARFETLFGIEMLQSLLFFVVGADTDAAQRRVILDQIAKLLSRVPPLTLARMQPSGESPSTTTMTTTNSVGVVNSLREFLLQMTLPHAARSDGFTVRDLPGYGKQCSTALTALVRVASARGQAADLLYVIYVLLQTALADAMARKQHQFLSSTDSTSATSAVSGRRVVSASHSRKKLDAAKKADKAHQQRAHHRSGLPGTPLKADSTGKGIRMTKNGGNTPSDKDRAVRPESAASSTTRGDTSLGAPLPSSSCNNSGGVSDTGPDLGHVLRHVWASKAQPEADSVAQLVKQLKTADARRTAREHVVAETADCGEVWSCGQNSYGELAHGDRAGRMTFKRVDCLRGVDVAQVAAGNEHTVVLAAAGDVYTSGYNDNGQCGHGTLHSVAQLKKIGSIADVGASQVHAYNGCEHTVVVMEDGRLASFGYNYRGQLGHGNTTSQAVPRLVRGPLEHKRVALVSCSYHHTIVATTEFETYSFGRNDFGQLGHGDAIDRKTPELISSLAGRSVASLACGQYHTCLVTKDNGGDFYACGKNDYGQLGFAAPNCVLKLTQLTQHGSGSQNGENRVRFSQVRCGYYHTLALTQEGRVWVHGRNDYGQLGLGHTTQRVYGPKRIDSIEHKVVVDMSAGCYHSVLVAENGALYVFGRNNHGQMGTGDTIDLHAPYAVDHFVGKKILGVAAGFYHTLVLARDVPNPESAAASSKSILGPSDAPPFSAASVLQNAPFDLADGQDESTASGPGRAECASPSSDSENVVVAANAGTKNGDPSAFRNVDVAMCLLAHMDRLLNSNGGPRSVAQFWEHTGNKPGLECAERRLYCVDASPETFELLLSLLISIFCNDPLDDDNSTGGSEYASKSTGAGFQGPDSSDESSPKVVSHGGPQHHHQQHKTAPLSTFEYQYMLLGLLRILRANVEYLLQLESKDDDSLCPGVLKVAGCRGEHASTPHSAVYAAFKDDAVLQTYRSAQTADKETTASRIWAALCGLQHQLVLIIQAPTGTGAGSDVVQQEAATVLMTGIDLFVPCQLHQAQLLGELLSVEYELPRHRTEDDREHTTALNIGGRTPAKRLLLNNLLHRLSKDEVASQLVPPTARTGRGRTSREGVCSSERVEGTLLVLAELLIECMVSHNRRQGVGATPASPVQNRRPSHASSPVSGTASTQELMRNALLALQKHVMLWAAAPVFSTTSALPSSSGGSSSGMPSSSSSSSPKTKTAPTKRADVKPVAPGASLVAGVCADLSADTAKAPPALCCLANFAEMVFGYGLEFLSTREHVTDLFGRGNPAAAASENGAFCSNSDLVLDTLQESIIGTILPSLIVGLLPFASRHPIAQRLLKHVVNLLKVFDAALQHVFTLKVAPDDLASPKKMLQLQGKSHPHYDLHDFHKLTWLQELTKSTAVFVGRMAGAVFVADDATVFSKQRAGKDPFVVEDGATTRSDDIQRWLESPLFTHGLEAQCVAAIERQRCPPDQGRRADSRQKTDSARTGPRVDADLGSPEFHRFCDAVRQAFSKLNRNYAIVALQISRSAEKNVVFDFERALAFAVLKQNDLLAQAKHMELARVPRRFLGLWSVIGKCTTFIWRRRSEMRGSGDYDPSQVNALLTRAASAAATLVAFRAETDEHSRSLCYVPDTLAGESLSTELTSARGRYFGKWRRAASFVRAVVRWRRCYGGEWKSRENRDPEVLQREADRFAGLGDIHRFVSEVVVEDAGRLRRIVEAVVRNYHRAAWRRVGIDAFTGLLRTLTTQTSQACVLYCLSNARSRSSIRGHFLHELDATNLSVKRSVENAFETLALEIASILRAVNERTRDATPALGTAEAQLLLAAINALGFSYTIRDWRYLRRTDVMGELCKLVDHLDGIVSPEKTASRLGDYASQIRSLVSHKSASNSTVDLTHTKQCLKAAWALFCLMVHSLRDGGPPFSGAGFATTASLDSAFSAFNAVARKALVKLDQSTAAVQDAAERDADILDSGFHSVGTGMARGTTASLGLANEDHRGGGPSPSSRADQSRRCQEIISSPVEFRNADTGVRVSSEVMLSNLDTSSNDFSIMFWLRVSQSATGHHRLVLSSGKRDKWLVLLLRDVDLRIETGIGSSTTRNLSDRVVSKVSLGLHRWTHVGLVSEGSKLRLYVDGALDVKSTCDATHVGGHQMYLGKMPDGILPLDGVRGGLQGSIANLRYYTRALSPIHVRILCDQGAPQKTSSVNDRWCTQICAHMFLSTTCDRSRRQFLSNPDWLELQLNALLYGTSPVQLSAVRSMCNVFPDLDPDTLAGLRVRPDWFVRQALGGVASECSKVTLSNAIGGPLDHVFVRFVLGVAGLALWRVDPSELGLPNTSSVRVSADAPLLQAAVSAAASNGDELSDVAILETSRILPSLVPRNVMRCYAPNAKGEAAVVTADDAQDLSMLVAELLGLLKCLCTRPRWRQAVCDVLKLVLTQRAPSGASLSCAADASEERVRSNGFAERLAALELLGGPSRKLRPGARATILQTNTRVAVVSTDERLSLAHVVPLDDESPPPVRGPKQKRSPEWPKIVRVNENELEYDDEHPLACEGRASLLANELLVPNVVLPHVLYQFEMTRDLLGESCIQWLPGRLKPPGPRVGSDSPTTTTKNPCEARVARLRSLASSVKVLCSLSENGTWRRALSQWPMLFSQLLQLAASADESTSFQRLDQVERKTLALRARLFGRATDRGGESESRPERERDDATTVEKRFARHMANFGVSEEVCAMALHENDNVPDAATWVLENIDALAAMDSVSKKPTSPASWKKTDATHDPATLFDERYFEDGLSKTPGLSFEQDKGAVVTAEEGAVSTLELLERSEKAELSLAILYARVTLLRVFYDWPRSASSSLLEGAESPKHLFNLFKLFVFRGEQFPSMEITRGGVVLNSLDATIRGGTRASLEIVRCVVKRMLDPETTPLYRAYLRSIERDSDLDVAKRTPNAAVRRWADQVFALCLATFEQATHCADETPLKSCWWSYRSLECSDLTALLLPNVELADWLARVLFEAKLPVAYEGPSFLRLMYCMSSPNPALQQTVAKLLANIARAWSNALGWEHKTSSCPRPPDAFFEYLFLGKQCSFLRQLRKVHAARRDLEQQQKRLCYSPYLNALSELLVQLGALEKHYLRTLESTRGGATGATGGASSKPAEVTLTDVCVERPRVVSATPTSLTVDWPRATRGGDDDQGKAGEDKNELTHCMYELEILDAIGGAEDDSSGASFSSHYRTVYRGARTETQIQGLVPSRSYQLRVSVSVCTARGDWVTAARGPPGAARTLSGPVFGFDGRSCGAGIRVSNNGLTATYEGNEAWSIILADQPLVAGCNQWEIKIEDSPTSCIFVGVATKDADVMTFLGGDEHSWGYIGDRALYHKRMKIKVYGERYSVGDVVGVTLDMNHGVMSFSKNSFDLGVAFEGLSGELYPAVAFYNRGQQVSIRAISYRCPGVGDVIPNMPRSYGIDELGEYLEFARALWRQRHPRVAVPSKVRTRAYDWFRKWCSGFVTRHPTFAGTDAYVDASKRACAEFGTAAGEMLQTSRGRSRVLGAGSGLLWFYPEGKDKAWFVTPAELQRLRALGYLQKKPVSDPCESSNAAFLTDDMKAEDANLFRRVPKQGDFDATAQLKGWDHDMDATVARAINEVAAAKDCSPWNVRPGEVVDAIKRKSHAREQIQKVAEKAGVDESAAIACRAALLYVFNEDFGRAYPHLTASSSDGLYFDADASHSSTTQKTTGGEDSRSSPWPNPPTNDTSRGGVSSRDDDERGQLSARRGDDDYDGGTLDFPHAFLHGYAERAPEACDQLRTMASAMRRVVFTCAKTALLDAFVKRTVTKAKPVEDDYDYPEDLPQVALNRLTAMTASSESDGNFRLAHSMFGQLYENLHFLEPRVLRMGYTHPMDDAQERTFKVKFEGEGVDDYGGPYREVFVQTPLELQAVQEHDPSKCVLPVFVPVEDGAKFAPRPAKPSRMRLEMLAFLGKLIGIAVRSKVTMQLDLPSRVWKALLHEPLHLEDVCDASESVLAAVDHELSEKQRQLSAESSFPEEPCDSAETNLTWTTTLSDGSEIELRPGGRDLKVAVAEAETYLGKAVSARLHENRDALMAMRAGLKTVLPSAILSVLTHDELARRVRGVQVTDLELLKANTEYDDDVHPDDPHIKFFWEALHSFTEHERTAFLRFVWARNRLPASQQEFHQKFKIQSVLGDGPSKDPDTYLPKSNTCFFSLSLPKYTSVQVTQEKLKYAMFMCVEMDADFRLAENELVRWFDVDD